MSVTSRARRLRIRKIGLAAVVSVIAAVGVSTPASAADESYQYEFEFLNGITLTGASPDKTAFIAEAGGPSVENPTGMEVHLSCSDKFPGGWGEKDGPEQSVDTAWQLRSFSIDKIKDGKVDKSCSGEFDPSAPPIPDGEFYQYEFEFLNGITLTGSSPDKTAFIAEAGGPSVENPTGMEVHLSCSDRFEGGWGEKDGPDQSVDTASQLRSFSIQKFKDGELDKSCGDDFGPPTPVGDPAIDIEKFVNGVDADDPTGPVVAVGDTVTFTYVVTNTGEVPLDDVVAVDLTLGPLTCPTTSLDVGASMDCDPNTEVVTSPGQKFMEAEVTATGETGAPGITDPIPGSGKGRQYSFTFVNGITLAGVAPDDNTYFLADAGGSSVENPTGIEVHLSCSDKFEGGWGEKDGPEIGVDTAWQLAAFEIVKFKDGEEDKRCGDSFFPVTREVSDSDPVYYLAEEPADPAVDIEKSVNGFDADVPPGPTVTVGDTVTFGYVVTNIGDVPLTDVSVVDSTLGPVECPQDTLAVGETIKCGPNTEVVVDVGSMFMEATVTAVGAGIPVDDVDPVNFVVVPAPMPAVDIEKSVNGFDADVPPGPTVTVGDTVTFGYVVTNIGDVPLTDVSVVDSTLGPVECPQDTLAVGETIECGPNTEVVVDVGSMFMEATVTAVGAGIPVDDVDPVNFVVVPTKPRPNIDIEKTVNGYDADTAPGPTFQLGDVLTFEYVVTNTGNTVVNDIVVVDDTLGTRTCPRTTLQPGESMSCEPATEVGHVPGQVYMYSDVYGWSPENVFVTDRDPVKFFVEGRIH